MSKTKIEWTGAGGETLNPVVGCSPARGSEQGGCRECYAQGQVHRFGERYRSAEGLIRLGKSPRDALTFLPTEPDGTPLGKGAKWTGEVWLLPAVLSVPLRRSKPTTYFVNSVSDLFHESIVDSEDGRWFIAALFGVMTVCPQHTFQCLTKRPKKAREWFAWVEGQADAEANSVQEFCVLQALNLLHDVDLPELANALYDRWLWADQREYGFEASDEADEKDCKRRIAKAIRNGAEAIDSEAWPLPGVWIGTSVENQATADARIPELLKIPAAIRFLSCEPLLGPVDLNDSRSWLTALVTEPGAPTVDWVIVGGESGQKARPMHPNWARSLRDQCVSAGTYFFFKQWGQYAPWMNEAWFTHGGEEKRAHAWVAASGDAGACWIYDDDGSWSNWTGDPPSRTDDPEEFDAEVMAMVGKKSAGRELDGRTWDEMPECCKR